MKPKPATEGAFRLMLEGSRALARVEANGMKLDMEYLDRAVEGTGAKIKELSEQLKDDDVWRIWKKHYGADADAGSPDQLGNIIFNVMGVPCPGFTSTGRPRTDEETLEEVDFPFVRRLMNLRKLEKVRSTYLVGWRRLAVNGYLHPSFNLHFVITFRSSCKDPNVQNVPNRDERQKKLIRRAFVPRSDDHILLEVDNSGAEVRCAACYHHDPTMVQYLIDDYDLHSDMADECYMLNGNVPKGARQAAKGGFVFAAFYGDWYKSTCQNLWYAAKDLKTTSGMEMQEHLSRQGITELGECNPKVKSPPRGTFEAHIKEIDRKFWHERFPVYTEWKNEWWKEYLKHGWFQMKTGFTCQGIYNRNDAINYPVQGSSFHITLWSLIELQKWLDRYKMKTKITGQVHDSIIFDVHRKEMQDVLVKIKQVMTVDVCKEWPWIIVPLKIDAEASEKSWYDKKEIAI